MSYDSITVFLRSISRQRESAGTRQRASASPDGDAAPNSAASTPVGNTGVNSSATNQSRSTLYQFKFASQFEREFLQVLQRACNLELSAILDLPGVRVSRSQSECSVYLVDSLICGFNSQSLRYLSKFVYGLGGRVSCKPIELNESSPGQVPGALRSESGGYRCECLVDWLQGSFPDDKTQEVFDLVGRYFGKLEDQKRKIRYYDRCFKSPNGVVVGLGHRNRDIQRGYFEASAGVVNQLPARCLRSFLSDMLDLGFIATRIDLSIDIFDEVISFFEVVEAVENQFYSGFRDSVNYYFNGRGGNKGAGLSLGNRGSAGCGKYYLVYCKDLESKHSRECLRFELSLYNYRAPSPVRGDAGAYAQQACKVFAFSDCSQWCGLIRAYHAWAVDFIDRAPKSKHGKKLRQPSKCDRLPWWDELLDGAAAGQFARCIVDRTLEKAECWLYDQVAPTFAAVREAINQVGSSWEDFLEAFGSSGESRLKESHHHLISQYVARYDRQKSDREKLDIISAFGFKLQGLLESSDEFVWSDLLSEYRSIENLALGLESQIPPQYWEDCARSLGSLSEFVDEFGVCRVPPNLDDLISWADQLRIYMRRILSGDIPQFSWDYICRRFNQVSILVDSDNPLLPAGLYQDLCSLIGRVSLLA